MGVGWVRYLYNESSRLRLSRDLRLALSAASRRERLFGVVQDARMAGGAHVLQRGVAGFLWTPVADGAAIAGIPVATARTIVVSICTCLFDAPEPGAIHR